MAPVLQQKIIYAIVMADIFLMIWFVVTLWISDKAITKATIDRIMLKRRRPIRRLGIISEIR